MNLFQRLPGSVRSAPGLEWALWRRLPAILLWGTLLPLVAAAVAWWATPANPSAGQDSALMLWNYAMIGVIVLHWSLVLTVAFGCVIVMVMKGPAYVADAYPLEVAADDAEGAARPTKR